jgi:hypothetical protein
MPNKDIFAAVAGSSESLMAKATESIEVCNKYMAIVSLCAIEANKRGKSLGGVRVGNIVMSDNRLVAKVSFSGIILPGTVNISPNVKTLVDFLHAEAEGLWLFIQKNPSFITYLEQLVTMLESYCRYKSIEFSELTFSQGFMDNDDNIVLEIEKGA